MYCIKLNKHLTPKACNRCSHNGYEKLQNCRDMNLKTNLYPAHKKAEENNKKLFKRYYENKGRGGYESNK